MGGALYGWLGRTTFFVIGIATIAVTLILLVLLYYYESKENENEDLDDLGEYEILDEDKSKIRYDDYDDINDDNIKRYDGDDKKSKDAAADGYVNDDNYETMKDDVKRHDGDDFDDFDDDYEQMEEGSSGNDYSDMKEHGDGDHFKFASPDDNNKNDNGKDSDNELHKRRPEDHKQGITEY